MSDQKEEIQRLANEFENCQKILLALGDANRQHLILEMMKIDRREGTKNYYYFDADTQAMDNLLQMLEHAKRIMEQLPNRENIK